MKGALFYWLLIGTALNVVIGRDIARGLEPPNLDTEEENEHEQEPGMPPFGMPPPSNGRPPHRLGPFPPFEETPHHGQMMPHPMHQQNNQVMLGDKPSEQFPGPFHQGNPHGMMPPFGPHGKGMPNRQPHPGMFKPPFEHGVPQKPLPFPPKVPNQNFGGQHRPSFPHGMKMPGHLASPKVKTPSHNQQPPWMQPHQQQHGQVPQQQGQNPLMAPIQNGNQGRGPYEMVDIDPRGMPQWLPEHSAPQRQGVNHQMPKNMPQGSPFRFRQHGQQSFQGSRQLLPPFFQTRNNQQIPMNNPPSPFVQVKPGHFQLNTLGRRPLAPKPPPGFKPPKPSKNDGKQAKVVAPIPSSVLSQIQQQPMHEFGISGHRQPHHGQAQSMNLPPMFGSMQTGQQQEMPKYPMVSPVSSPQPYSHHNNQPFQPPLLGSQGGQPQGSTQYPIESPVMEPSMKQPAAMQPPILGAEMTGTDHMDKYPVPSPVTKEEHDIPDPESDLGLRSGDHEGEVEDNDEGPPSPEMADDFPADENDEE